MTINTEGIILSYPQFTSSITLDCRPKEPVWKKPDEVMEHLVKLGSPIRSKGMLLYYERKGMISVKRIGKRKVYYDLNEIERLFTDNT